MTPRSVRVYERGREPELLLPTVGERIAIYLGSARRGATVGGVVAEASIDRESGYGYVRFDEGSEVRAFSSWNPLPNPPSDASVLAQRLEQLKRTNVPRLRASDLHNVLIPHGACRWQDDDERAAVDAYLRAFARLTHDVALICPGCETRGWPIGRAGDACVCGWPCRIHHRVHDERPEAFCARCSRTRAKHVKVEQPFAVGGMIRVDYVCPPVEDANTFSPPLLLALDLPLWAHPYDVKAR